MPARPISSGTISFGLVSIPIKVFSATQAKGVRFNMLHEDDKSRLKQQYVCSGCGEVVSRNQTVKGYEYAKGQYVVMTDEELKALEKHGDKAIEIEEFIPIEQVDPVYYDRSQLLGPDKGGGKAYRLLRDAMRNSGKVAIGRFATRGREQLVLLRPVDEGLVMHALYYADEVRSFDDVDLGDDVEFKKGELALAEQLIDQLTNDEFDAKAYEDDYRQAVLGQIERKVAGEEVVVVAQEEAQEQIIDLVAALKASIESKQDDDSAPSAGRARKAPKAKGKDKDDAGSDRKAATG